MGEQRIVLKDHAHPPTLRRQEAAGAGHLPPIDPDPTTLGLLEAGDQAQQGGLAAAGGAQQAQQFARGQGEINPPQGPGISRRAAVAMPDSLQADAFDRRWISGMRGVQVAAGQRDRAWAGGGSGIGDRQGP